MSIAISPCIAESEFQEFFSLLKHDLRFPLTYAEWISQLRHLDALNIFPGDIVKKIVIHPVEFASWNSSQFQHASVPRLHEFAIQKNASTEKSAH